MRRVGPILVAGAALSLGGAVGAQTAPVSLTWEAPAQCPSREAVLTRVAQLRSANAPAAPLSASARVTREGRRWRVRIETPGGVRSLAALRCDALGEATAVILALALDDAAPAPESPRPALPAEVEQLEDPELPPVLRPPPPAPPPPRAPRVELGARALVDANALPDTGFGASLALALQWRVARLELAPTLAYGARSAIAPQSASLRALRASLTTRLCAMSSGRARLGLCALVDLGWLRSSADGFTTSGGGDAPWVAGGASLLARLGGARLAGVVALDVALPITRPRFVVQGAAAAWEVPALTVTLSAGLSFEM
ncbi:MAG: hypothetical protein R3A48_08040 [Polyangiales bacterium]